MQILKLTLTICYRNLYSGYGMIAHVFTFSKLLLYENTSVLSHSYKIINSSYIYLTRDTVLQVGIIFLREE